MQSSSVRSSGRSARSGRSGSGVEKVVEGRKKVVTGLKKVAAERDGWTAVKGRRERRSKESSEIKESFVLCEKLFPSLEKERKEKEQLWRELLEQKKRERKARAEEKRVKKVEKQLEEANKELESQREQRKVEKLQLKREKEVSGSERRIAAGFKRARKKSSEERVVGQILSACQILPICLQPEQKKRRSGRSSEVGVSKVVKVVFPVEESVLEGRRRRW